MLLVSEEQIPISVTSLDLPKFESGRYTGVHFLETMLYVLSLSEMERGNCTPQSIRIWSSEQQGNAVACLAGLMQWIASWSTHGQTQGDLFRITFQEGHFLLYWVHFSKCPDGSLGVQVYAMDGLNLFAPPESAQMQGPLWRALEDAWNQWAPTRPVHFTVSYQRVKVPWQGHTNNCAYVIVELVREILSKKCNPEEVFYGTPQGPRLCAARHSNGLGTDQYQGMRQQALRWVRQWCGQNATDNPDGQHPNGPRQSRDRHRPSNDEGSQDSQQYGCLLVHQ